MTCKCQKNLLSSYEIGRRMDKANRLEISDLSCLGESNNYSKVFIYNDLIHNQTYYRAELNRSYNFLKWHSVFFTEERDAAKAVDMELIRRGKSPINVLKRL